MAHIEIRPTEGRALHVLLNGMDISNEIYADTLAFETIGDDPLTQEIGIRMTFALSSLAIGDENIPPRAFAAGKFASDGGE